MCSPLFSHSLMIHNVGKSVRVVVVWVPLFFIQTPYYICANSLLYMWYLSWYLSLLWWRNPRSFRFFILMGEMGTSKEPLFNFLYLCSKGTAIYVIPKPRHLFRTVCGMRKQKRRDMLGFSRVHATFPMSTDWWTIFDTQTPALVL